jgi:hypothetical protein
MAWTLFVKECKELSKSITYFVFLICTVIFFISQMGGVDLIEKPVQGKVNYGWKYSDDESVIMESSLEKLLYDLSINSFATYPVGFYKEVTLDKDEKNKIYQILEKVTALTSNELKKAIELYFPKMNSTDNGVNVRESLSFRDFCNAFNKIDVIIGGGSYYSEKRLYSNTRVDKTYDEALDEYESIIENDHISGAYARIFSDYMGIILAIMPVFLAVTRVLRDKRAKAEQIIYSKRCSSVTVVLTRYLAIIVMILIPVIIFSINPLLQCIYSANKNGITVDYFAFLKAIFGWILPTVLFTVSMGFLFTEITNGPIAILIQGIWWMFSVFLASSNLVGYVGLNLVPRFNTVGDYDVYKKIYPDLVMNRIYYVALSVFLLTVSIIIYDLNRRGKWIQNDKIFKHS